MRIKCHVSTTNRLCPNNLSKPIYASVALCKKSIGSNKGDEKCIVVNTTQSKIATVYKVEGNIEKIFTKYINEGKATIQFSSPPHDVYVQKSDPLQLKSFFRALRLILTDCNSKTIRLTTFLSTTGRVTAPQRQLSVKSKRDYPKSSFPNSLEKLSITSCDLIRFDNRILKLRFLTTLNLSSNKLKTLPNDLRDDSLPNLRELNLNNNQLSEIPEEFLKLASFGKNLQSLHLQHNLLTVLPPSTSSLGSLIFLRVDHNQLSSLPEDLGKLSKLEVLTASHNLLEYLPGSIKRLHLREVDFFYNRFKTEDLQLPEFRPAVASLVELSASSIVKNKLSYDDESLPKILQNYLGTVKWCMCSNPCFESGLSGMQLVDLHSVAESVMAMDRLVPCKVTFCSFKCQRIFNARPRYRHNLLNIII